MSTQNSIDISVIIPAYNEEKYLTDTIQNIKSTFKKLNFNYEIIVVDNASTDNTSPIANKSGCNVNYEPVRGIAKSRNTGAKNSSGKVLLFLDADTKINHRLIEKSYQKIKEGYVFAGSIIKFDKKLPLAGKVSLAIWIFISMNLKWMAGSYMMVKKEHWSAVNGLDESLYISEEINFSRRLNKFAKRNNLKKGIIVPLYPAVTSARKLYDFTFWESLKLLFPMLIHPFEYVRNRKYCDFWYIRR